MSDINEPLFEESTVNIETLPELLTPKQAGDYLGVTPQSVRNYEKNGHISSIRVGHRNGGERRFHKADIVAFKESILYPNGRESPKVLYSSEIEYCNKLMAIAQRHYEAAGSWKSIIDKILMVIDQRITKCLENGDTDAVLEFASKQAHLFNYWSLTYDRAIKWETESTGLKQFIDVNTAANTLTSRGYIIIDPTQTNDSN
jgi:excisionase family DNA binding protein